MHVEICSSLNALRIILTTILVTLGINGMWESLDCVRRGELAVQAEAEMLQYAWLPTEKHRLRDPEVVAPRVPLFSFASGIPFLEVGDINLALVSNPSTLDSCAQVEDHVYT